MLHFINQKPFSEPNVVSDTTEKSKVVHYENEEISLIVQENLTSGITILK